MSARALNSALAHDFKLSLNALAFLDLNDSRQDAFPDRFGIKRPGFQSLNACIKKIQPRIDGVETSFEPSFNGVKAREYSFFKSTRSSKERVSERFGVRASVIDPGL